MIIIATFFIFSLQESSSSRLFSVIKRSCSYFCW